MPKDKTSNDTRMSEQTMKAAARESAKTAPKTDPRVAAEAINDAQSSRRSNRPAQKLSATLLKDAGGDNRHHPKDQILSEFDGPRDA